MNRLLTVVSTCAALSVPLLGMLAATAVKAQSGGTQPALECVQVRDDSVGHHAFNTCARDITIVISNQNGTLAPGRVRQGGAMVIMPVSMPYKVAACVAPGIPTDPSTGQWAGFNSQRYNCPID